MAFAFSFARDEEGELTPLAAAYKRLMPKYLDSFSVGIMVNDYDMLEDKSGLDVKKSTLFEISAVAIPANAEANAMKFIKSVFKEQDLPLEEEKVEEKVEESAEKIIENDTNVEENPPVEEESNTINDNNEEIKSFIASKFGALEERLDSIEAQLAVQSKALNEQTDKPKSRSAEEIESLKQIKQALNKIKGFKTK